MMDKTVHIFAWRMFHLARAYGATIEDARQYILNTRPEWIPEGTELRYVCSRGPLLRGSNKP
jgi:hypothetical protein